MNDEEIFVSVSGIFGKMRIHTGWNLPEVFAGNKLTLQGKELINEISIAFRNHYENLTHNEIILAIRNHSHKVREYGKDFNTSLLHEVMNHYLIERQEAIEIEKEFIEKTEIQKPIDPEQLKNITRKNIEDAYQLYLKGDYKNSLSDHVNYEQLIEDKISDKDVYLDFMQKGLQVLKIELNKMLFNTDNKKEQEEIKHKISLLKSIEQKAKSIAFTLCLDYIKNHNIKNIYTINNL